MDSLGKHCTPLKQKYEQCFNHWYSEKFLKGDTKPECEDLFKEYRECVTATVKEKGIWDSIQEAREKEEKKKNTATPTTS